ncbi:MAG: MmcB family DNA repair protein [Eubacterium sp.]|nr:MmcB family DNA repair protein [Eubacterium sp.]
MLDKDIREKLYDYLDERYGKVRTIEEKVILKSRADMLAIVDGEIIGIEIKSDSDTYTRLKTQIKDYEKFCDRCYVAVGESHIHVAEHIPDYWGILIVSEENVIVERDADISPKVNMNNQLDILWRAELYAIQEKEGLPKLRNWKRRDIYKRLIDTAGEEAVKKDITDALFERDYTIFDRMNVRDDLDETLLPEHLTYESDKVSQKTSDRKVRKKNRGTKRKTPSKLKGVAGDKKRAHVTNYIGPRKKK